jgi:hypothetical protein
MSDKKSEPEDVAFENSCFWARFSNAFGFNESMSYSLASWQV